MILNISGINIYFDQYLNKSSRPSHSKNVILIHGFTGSSKDWEEIIPRLSKDYNYYAIDLIGHGNSDSHGEKKHYNADFIIELIQKFIADIFSEKVFLIGYSMGGRAALTYSAKYPETLEGLILESSTAGIKNENERKDRIKNDEEIAKFIGDHSIEEFIDFWMNLDTFNTQRRFSNSKLTAIKKSKLNNNKVGLSNFLRGFGTGQMPQLYDKLKNIKCKTLLITGDLDEKFTLINKEMASILPDAKHISIKNSGHNTHLEEPKKFIDLINKYLQEF
jgi:2-succinyl-6-hydroxy-2,4-cyclohexadiene-1-carboxylate synthase